MRYISPFALLNIEPGGLFDSPEVIKRRRKELLAQITLDGPVTFEKETIDRAAAIRILADLDDLRLRRHHERILLDEPLHNFLRAGKCSDVLNLPAKPHSYRKFLEPYLIDQVSEALDQGLRSGDGVLISNLVNTNFNFESESWKKAFRPARRHFRAVHQSLAEKKRDLEDDYDIESILPPSCQFNDTETNRLRNRFVEPLRIQPHATFLDSLITTSDLVCLNTLPESFQDLRNEIANGLDGIAVVIYNDLDEEEIALDISELANQIDVGAKDGERIRNNLRVISDGVNKLRISDTSAQLNIVAGLIREGHFESPDGAVAAVMTIFDVPSFNTLSKPSVNSEIIELTKQVREISWLLITSFKSVPASILLIQECMKLRLSDNAVQKALEEKLVETKECMLASEFTYPGLKPKTSRVVSPAQSPQRPKVNKTRVLSNEIHFGESLSDDVGIFRSIYRLSGGLMTEDGLKALAVLGGFAVFVIIIFAVRFSNGVSNLSNENRSLANSQPTRTPVEQNRPRPTISNIPTSPPSQSAAPVSVRPKTGSVFTRSGGGGLGQIEISNGLSVDSLVRLRDVVSGKAVREVYIRSKELSTIRGIAPGNYEVMFATGYDFNTVSKSFGSNGSYEKFDEVFTFSQTRESGGTRYRVLKIALNKVLNGNLNSSSVSPDDFNR